MRKIRQFPHNLERKKRIFGVLCNERTITQMFPTKLFVISDVFLSTRTSGFSFGVRTVRLPISRVLVRTRNFYGSISVHKSTHHFYMYGVEYGTR